MTSRNIWFFRSAATRALLSVMVLGLLVGMPGCSTPPSFDSASYGEDVNKSVEGVELRPGLVVSLSVLVAGNKEIDEPAKRVSDGGTLMLPLLGEMTVSGMSLDDLQTKLVNRYKEYFVQPQVIVDFVRGGDSVGISPWGYITVLGKVAKPGRIAIPATRDLTISGAIQMAGGFAPSAKDSAILVTRSLPDGQTKTRTINLHSVGAEGRVGEDIVLEANDVVFVPEKMF
jgi:protein involved in polysaccharide export with SLBB domain